MSRKKPVEVDKLLPFEGNASFRTKRPAFADAIDLLASNGWRLHQVGGQVKVGSFRLPSGRTASLVIIIGNIDKRPNVGLPWCGSISATDSYGNRSEYDPQLFHDALIDEDGNVELKCGTFLNSCTVTPTMTAPEWTPEKHDVVLQLIVFMGVEEQCLQQLEILPEFDWAGFVPFRLPDQEPALGALSLERKPIRIDYAKVRALDLTGLKLEAFWQFHKEKTKQAKQHLSRQTVANILRHAGIRIPGPVNRC